MIYSLYVSKIKNATVCYYDMFKKINIKKKGFIK